MIESKTLEYDLHNKINSKATATFGWINSKYNYMERKINKSLWFGWVDCGGSGGTAACLIFCTAD